MNAMTISFVLVRLAAAFLFVRGVQGLSAFSYLLTGDAQIANFAVVTLVFSVILPTAIAIILWLHPEKVTGAQRQSPRDEMPMNAGQIMMIGITLLGLYVLVYGLVDLFQIETTQLMQRQMAAANNLPNEVLEQHVIISRVTYGVQIVLGICLMFGRRGLTTLFQKAKYGGVTTSREDE